MAITNVSAERFNNLKARLKAVFKSRTYYGDLSGYANTSYDFTVEPATGNIILSDHGAKVINLILTVTDVGTLKLIERDNYILRDISAIEAMVTKLEAQVPLSSTNYCRGGCAGICVAHCSTGCVGSCLSACTGSCMNTCSDKCSTTCTGSCTQSCSAACIKDCSSSCVSGCKAGTNAAN